MLNELMLPIDYPDFQEFGPSPCSKANPDDFFPAEFSENNPKAKPVYLNEREAKLICSTCPYKLRCLEYALKNPIEQGIWGGTTEYDRKKLRHGLGRSMMIVPSKRR